MDAEDFSVEKQPQWSFGGGDVNAAKLRSRFPGDTKHTPGAINRSDLTNTSYGYLKSNCPTYTASKQMHSTTTIFARNGPGPGAYSIDSGLSKKTCVFGSSDRSSIGSTPASSLAGYIGPEELKATDLLRRPASPSFSFGKWRNWWTESSRVLQWRVFISGQLISRTHPPSPGQLGARSPTRDRQSTRLPMASPVNRPMTTSRYVATKRRALSPHCMLVCGDYTNHTSPDLVPLTMALNPQFERTKE